METISYRRPGLYWSCVYVVLISIRSDSIMNLMGGVFVVNFANHSVRIRIRRKRKENQCSNVFSVSSVKRVRHTSTYYAPYCVLNTMCCSCCVYSLIIAYVHSMWRCCVCTIVVTKNMRGAAATTVLLVMRTAMLRSIQLQLTTSSLLHPLIISLLCTITYDTDTDVASIVCT